MTVEVNDIIRATAVLTVGRGIEINNVYHFRKEPLLSDIDQVVIEDIALFLDDAYDFFAGVLANDVTFSEIRFFNETQDREMASSSWPNQTVGGSAGTRLPQANAALVYFRTGYPRVLGKKYIGSLTATSITDSLWNAPLVAALASAFAPFIGPFLGPANASTLLAGINTLNHGFAAFTEVVATDNPVVQRRRRFLRGI